MTAISQSRPPRYHHFVLLVWEERDAEGLHEAWRFSLQDSQNEARIGFKSMEELVSFLEKWIKDSSADESNNLSPKEKIK